MINIAYFLGGPEDLTKKVIGQPLPVLRVPQLLDTYPPSVKTEDIPDTVWSLVHSYERVNVFRFPYENKEVHIYMYKGKD